MTDRDLSLCRAHAPGGGPIGQDRGGALHMSAEQSPHDKGEAGSRSRVDWLVTQDPYQTSSDWDQPNCPSVGKAPGWVRAIALFGLPLLIWVMLLFTPVLLLSILIVLGSALYWSSRRGEGSRASPFSQRKSDCCLSADTQTEESDLGERSQCCGETNSNQRPSWAALFFWVSIGGLTVRHLLDGAGS